MGGWRRVLRIVALALSSAAIFSSASAVADVVELKTGQRVEGVFKEATTRGVSVEVGGQIITFAPDKVRAIYFGPAPTIVVQPSLRDDAIRSLKALESAIKADIAYNDYATIVSATKIVVDRYTNEKSSGSDPARAPIVRSMQYFSLAQKLW